MTYFPLNFKEQAPKQKHDKKLRRFNLTMKCSSNYAHNGIFITVSAGLRHLLLALADYVVPLSVFKYLIFDTDHR